MTNEELVELYQNGDKQALSKLIEKNTGIVYKLAGLYYTDNSNSMDNEDLVQEGFLGLMAAADRYKLNMKDKAKFITYAIFLIKGKILRYIENKNTCRESSLNIHIADDEVAEFQDHIEYIDYGFENVEEEIYRMELRKELEEVMLEKNTLMEREILKLFYGWHNNKSLTSAEIGELFNIASSSARNIKLEALRKIRTSMWVLRKRLELYKEFINLDSCYSINQLIKTLDIETKYNNYIKLLNKESSI